MARRRARGRRSAGMRLGDSCSCCSRGSYIRWASISARSSPTAFLAGAVLAIQRRHIAMAAVLASSAVLTRETTAILPIVLLVAAGWQMRRRDRPSRRAGTTALAIAGIVPLAALGAWQLWLRWSWHALPLTTSADKNVRFPFQGLVDSVDKIFPPSSGAVLFRDVSLGFLIVVIGLGCVALRRSAAPLYIRTGFTLGALLLALLSSFPGPARPPSCAPRRRRISSPCWSYSVTTIGCAFTVSLRVLRSACSR